MAVKAPHALEDQVNGGQVAHQQVEVDVEGLLHHLRGHNDRPVRPAGAGARRPEAAEEVVVLGEAVADGEAGVVEAHVLAEDLA